MKTSGPSTLNLIFSRRLAIAIGIALIAGETLRLCFGGPIAWGMDHYLMALLLLFGAWKSRRFDSLGQRYLLAAWAFTCGVEYMNIVGHLELLFCSKTSQISPAWLGIIGIGYLLCILGLVASFKAPPDDIWLESKQTNSKP